MRCRLAVAPVLATLVAAMLPGTAAAADLGPVAPSPVVRSATVAAVRWNPCAPVVYAVNAGRATPGAVADVQAAMARVSRETGLVFRYAGATSRTTRQAYPPGVRLLVEWVTPGTGSLPAGARGPLGVGGWHATTAWTADGRATMGINRGYVSIDATKQSRYPTGSRPRPTGGGSRVQLLMHEVAHAIGLDHTGSRVDLMHPLMSRYNSTWSATDRARLRAAGRLGGCLLARRPAPAASRVGG